MNEDISELTLPLLVVFTLMITCLIFVLSIPFWSDTKKVCKYWEEQDGKMVCIQEETVFCLEKECS